MAKISELPLLGLPSGDETVPVLKDGETFQAPVSQLVESAVDAVLPIELTYKLDRGLPNGSAGNGAVLRRRGGVITGLTIPAGTTGNDSFVLQTIDVRGIGVAGGRVRIRMASRMSAASNLSLLLYVRADRVGGAETILGASAGMQDGNEHFFAVEYDVPADTLALTIFPYLLGNVAAPDDRWFESAEIRLRVITAPQTGLSNPSSETLAASNRRLAAQIRSNERFYAPPVLVTEPGAGGDFTSIRAAIASIDNASRERRGLILVGPRSGNAPYLERDILGSDFIDILSIDDSIIEIRGELPDDAAPAAITQSSTLDVFHDMLWRGFRITARNMRYAAHADSPASGSKLLRTELCQFEHLGNEGARQYQLSQGHDPDVWGSPQFIWRSLCAWGSGLWSASKVEHFRTSFVAPVDAYLAHDPAEPPAPEIGGSILAEYCTFAVAGGDGTAIKLQSYGGGKPMLFTAIGCLMDGRIECTINAGTRQWWTVDGYGNTGAAFVENGQYLSRMI